MKTKLFNVLLLPLLFCLILTTSIWSQSNNNIKSNAAMHILGQSIEGQILLRWGPSDYELWQHANEVGFVLQRAVVPTTQEGFENYQYDPSFTKIIKPLKKDDPKWKELLDKDTYATAAWISLYEEKPTTDGNLAQMIKEQDNVNKKAFFTGMLAADHSHKAAQSMGLGYVDTDVELGQNYIYKVSIATDSTLSDIELVEYVGNRSQEMATPPSTESREKGVQLKWSRDFDGGNFTSYILERSDNRNGPFTSITNTPYLRIKSNPNSTEESFAFFTDSIGVNYKPFYYRIIGINPFGIKSIPSTVVMGMGVDLSPPTAPYSLKVDEESNKTIKLSWKKDEEEDDFSGYIVSKALDINGPFQAIHEGELPFTTKTIIDENPGVALRNYYSIAAIDTAGNVSTTMVNLGYISDDQPIQVPTGLTGSIDEDGTVHIQWEKSPDPRVIGYKVYASNSPKHRFLMKSEDLIKGTEYAEKIALRTLSERVIYKVASVNIGYAYSELSEGLELKRPDIVAPSFSVFNGREIKGDTVRLSWAISHSHDLVEQRLWRKTEGGEWELLASFDTSVNSYEDRSLEPGILYEYALQSIDDAGLESEMSPVITASISAYQELNSVENVTVEYDKDSEEMKISWKYPKAEEYNFLVYKAVDSPNLIALTKVNGSKSFLDKRIKKGKMHRYGIRVMRKDGIESSIARSNSILAK